jgi:hypothetical protein
VGLSVFHLLLRLGNSGDIGVGVPERGKPSGGAPVTGYQYGRSSVFCTLEGVRDGKADLPGEAGSTFAP